MSGFTVRAATAADLVDVCQLAEHLAALHHAAAPANFAPAGDPSRDEAHWLESLVGRDRQGFIAMHGDKPIGFVTLSVYAQQHTLLRPRRLAQVNSICVAPEFRGRGAARALMAEAERWAVAQGAAELRLLVWDFNAPAMALYRGLGYAVLSHAMAKPLPAGDAD